MKRRSVRLLLVFVLALLVPVGGLTGCSGPTGGGRGPSPSPVSSPTAPTGTARTATPTAAPPSSSPTPASASPTSATPTPPGTIDGLLGGIVRAVDSRDRSGYLSLVSDQDPGFTGTAGMIFDNLLAIHPGDFRLRATGNRRELSTKRSSTLGGRAYAAEVRVSWSVPGDTAAADERVWMTVVPNDGRLRWGGIADGPKSPRPTPLWWLEPVRYGHSGAATVITGTQANTKSWLAAANTAIAQDVPKLHDADWNEQLVIIVPSNERLMEQSLGAVQGADSELAAISWPDGTTGHAPIRIMINPAGQPSALATAIVLAHETVHVATRSPVSRAPTWLVEGYADYIAYRGYPQAAQPAAADLLAEVKQHGAPEQLPGESDFAVGRHDLNRSYAEAWLACRYLAERFGDQKLWRFYQAVDMSRDGSITGPARSIFGASEQQLVAGWQRYLESAAERGRI